MPRVYLGIGSNQDRERALVAGLTALEVQFGAMRLSTIYESAAVGFAGEPFYNLVAEINTQLTLSELATWLRQLEYQEGRPLNAQKYAPRRLDIDILLYGDLICADPVELPRAEILTQAFVLRPLSELAPNFLHPQLQRPMAALWHEHVEKMPLKPVAIGW